PCEHQPVFGVRAGRAPDKAPATDKTARPPAGCFLSIQANRKLTCLPGCCYTVLYEDAAPLCPADCAGTASGEVGETDRALEWLVRLAARLERGEDTVCVTVVAGTGSIPRQAGARMLVGREGYLLGTIGGGAVEHVATQRAAEALEDRRSFLHRFLLHPNQAADLGMICGGDVTVYFQFIPGEHPETLTLCAAAEDARRDGREVWLAIDITDEQAWRMALWSPDSVPGACLPSRPGRLDREGRRYYVEPLCRAGRVCIFGGGHVAQALVPVLASVGFRCVVMDDRPEFAAPALFPRAEEVVLGDFSDIFRSVAVSEADYVVIATRGHLWDYQVQRQVLGTPATYLGCIGSRKKVAAIGERLRAEGFSDRDIARFHSPIGLPIQAQTPEEIAVSIAAELILHRATHRRGP
ncbi:MAG: XdhC family protein, partial [Clostridiales bacterium]|nr:XdhC family protein [Clostridiales bacterium]